MLIAVEGITRREAHLLTMALLTMAILTTGLVLQSHSSHPSSCSSHSSASNYALRLPTYLLWLYSPWLYLLQVLAGLPTSLAEDEAALLQLQGNTGRGAQALHSRLSRKRCLTASRDACDAMWKTRRLRPRPAGSPEAPSSARSCLRLPRASASLGQSAAWAALAGHIGLVFHIAHARRTSTRRRAPGLGPRPA